MKYTNPDDIQTILDYYTPSLDQKRSARRVPYLKSIHQKGGTLCSGRRVHPDGLIHERALPLFALNDRVGRRCSRVYYLCNSDTKYRSPYGGVALKDITAVVTQAPFDFARLRAGRCMGAGTGAWLGFFLERFVRKIAGKLKGVPENRKRIRPRKQKSA